MKTILSKFKKWKSKKAAADLISIIISVVLIAALVLGILLFLSNKVRQTAMDEINNTMSTITGIAEANRNNTDIVIPGGPDGPDGGEEPEINVPVTHEGIIPEGGTYYVGVTSIYVGDYSGATATYTAGQAFPTTINDGDVYVYEDYEYKYNYLWAAYGQRWTKTYNSWEGFMSEPSNGWGVRVLDSSKDSYHSVLFEINEEPLVCMQQTYYDCNNLEDISEIIIPGTVQNLYSTFGNCENIKDASSIIIPNSVEDMAATFANCSSLEKAPSIPESVKSMSSTFSDCSSLINAPIIPNNVLRINAAFMNCSSLEGEIEINATLSSKYDAGAIFIGTVKEIKIVGSCQFKAEMAATATNGNVTY